MSLHSAARNDQNMLSYLKFEVCMVNLWMLWKLLMNTRNLTNQVYCQISDDMNLSTELTVRVSDAAADRYYVCHLSMH